MKLVHKFLIIVLCSIPCSLSAIDWRDIDPADLERTEPRIDPNADAETIFWEVWVEDDVRSRSEPYIELRHYLRMKIYTEKGVEDQSTVELASFGKKRSISSVSGRTILPDGTIVQLKGDSVFDKDIVRNKFLKARGKSFSLPAVEPGAIIEYQWKETRNGERSDNMRLDFQRDTPSWMVRYFIKPSQLYFEAFGQVMFRHGMNMELSDLEDVGQGFKSMFLANVPAFRVEPNMPPASSVRPWTLLYYAKPGNRDPQKYWNDLSKELYGTYSKEMKPDKKVRAAVAEITAGATTDEEKVEKILAFCQKEIVNIYHDSSGLTAEQRDEVDENKKPSDTLAQKKGTSRDISYLFGALVQSVGLDARYSFLSGRDAHVFDAQLMSMYMINRSNIAVRIGEDWKFYDPSAPYLQSGMLRWQEEGVHALITDPKELLFVQTPFSAPKQTQARREGRFTLSEDGTLEGDVRVIYTGHWGYGRKVSLDGQTEDEREEEYIDAVERRLATAEVEELEINNVTERDQAIEYKYHVKVPNFAQATGKRLFVPVSYFQYNRSPRFTGSERKFDIEFDYAWYENDYVEIKLPAGFLLDNPEAPSGSSFGPTGAYVVSLHTNEDRDTLMFRRELTWGNEGAISFPVSAYSALKGAWDHINTQDKHVISVMREEAADGGAE